MSPFRHEHPIYRLAAILVVAFLLAPIAVVTLASVTRTSYVAFPPRGLTVRWFWMALQEPNFYKGLVTSLKVSALAAIAATGLGTLAALGLDRSGPQARSILEPLFTLPLAVPTVAIGLALLLALSLSGIGSSLWILALVQGTLGLPYTIRFVSTAIEGIPRHLYWAAQDLGCPPRQVTTRVVLPIIRPSIMAGAAFGFVVAFDELTIALFLAGPSLVTLPVAMYTYIEYSFDPLVIAMATLSIAISAVVILVIQRTVGLEALGR